MKVKILNEILLGLLIIVLCSVNSEITAQPKGNSAYSKAEKLQKLLDLSDSQKARVVSILMSPNYGSPINDNEGRKNKINYGNHLNEINIAIDQILTVEQASKFNQIRSNWITMKVDKNSDDSENKPEKKKTEKTKKVKKNKKTDGGDN